MCATKTNRFLDYFVEITVCPFIVQEFAVSTNVLRNETAWTVNNGLGLAGAFLKIGERGPRSQSSTSGIDRNNVQFFNLVQQNAIGCWNTNRPYSTQSVDIVARDNTTLVFPNDLKIDQELEQVKLEIFFVAIFFLLCFICLI